MGCGKTTVGRSLAQQLGLRLIDMDAYIEQKTFCRVRDIFEKQGEAAFRAIEAEACRSLSALEGLVIATGGGAVLNEENAAALRAGGRIVFIDVPMEVVELRLRGDRSRPLLAGGDRAEKLRALYEERRPQYLAAAGLVVENRTNEPASLVAVKIAREIARLAAASKQHD